MTLFLKKKKKLAKKKTRNEKMKRNRNNKKCTKKNPEKVAARRTSVRRAGADLVKKVRVVGSYEDEEVMVGAGQVGSPNQTRCVRWR